MKRYIITTLFAFSFLTINSQSLKEFTLGSYHPKGKYTKNSISYDRTLGGIEGVIFVNITDDEIIYEISFSPANKKAHTFDGVVRIMNDYDVFLPSTKFNTFLNDLEHNYDIQFIKVEESKNSNVYNYTCTKKNVKYNVRAVKYSDAYRFSFDITRLDLLGEKEKLEETKRKGDF